MDGLIGYNLRRAYLVIARDFAQSLAGVDLGPVQFTILTLIDANPGCTQNIIAKAISIKRTNFVALLDGLEAQGLAERRPSPTDRRSHALYLTHAGQTMLADLKPRIIAHEQKFAAIMSSAEADLLRDLLVRLRRVGADSADETEI
ncbi:MarR family winged helix-turn-helix transcriptional regulator [Elstera litoralis]|nr:MarR family transcriptional regulator [Elstera litoralis]